MRIYTSVIFLFVFLLSTSAQGQTILFRSGSDVLIDTYRGNIESLSKIGAVIEANRADILEGNGYIELYSSIKSNLITNNSLLNTAAIQASVVKAQLMKKYGISGDKFTFYFLIDYVSDCVDVVYKKGSIPSSAQRDIFFSLKRDDKKSIDKAISRYGAKIIFAQAVGTIHYGSESEMIGAINGATSDKSESEQERAKIAQKVAEPFVMFRHGSETIYRAYKENREALDLIYKSVEQNLSDIELGSRVINLTSYLPKQQLGNKAAINLASLRAAVLRKWLISNFATLNNDNFRFIIDHSTNESVKVECVPTSDGLPHSKIYFTLDKENRDKIEQALSYYKSSPLFGVSVEYGEFDMDFVNSALDPTEITIVTGGDDEKISITLYFRWDKSNIDANYLTNTATLHTIDSVMSLKSAEYIDTLRITAFASPEGAPIYNQKLSERRAESFRQYILNKYPKFSLSKISAEGKGENWDEFRRMALADSNLPRKELIVSIIDNPKLTLIEREARIVNLDGGQIYKNYIYPKYYSKLRSGASLFVIYNPEMPVDINFEPISLIVTEPEPETVTPEPAVEEPSYRYIRPFAVKTNLLFDIATLFNIEVEVPIGKRFSVLGEWTFPFWGGLGNRGGVAPLPIYSENYTLQMLSGGLEGRYWFPRGENLNERAERWGDYNPLNGWFVGLYGGAGIYDFQRDGKGMQGEFYIASGVSGGYAHPIGKFFHLEYSLGFGYVATRYYKYTGKDGHKVTDIRSDGKYDRRQQSFFGPTKLKFGLVWIPRFKVNNKNENLTDEK